jgi:hypothetical protein
MIDNELFDDRIKNEIEYVGAVPFLVRAIRGRMQEPALLLIFTK